MAVAENNMRQRKNKNNKTQQRRVIPLEARTENQKDYIRAIIENDVIFCTGPSGTGKSFISAGIASEHLHREQVDTVIITRPLVCTGKEIGYLPGEVRDKIKPYLMPMEENLRFFMGRDYFGHFFNCGRIKFEPLETMRGSTFHDSYMILDEAQNCTVEQIKMFITRMGECSKVIINGDIQQTDLRNRSGLEHCIEKLDGIEGVGVCHLDFSDIQRNGIIGRILNALE